MSVTALPHRSPVLLAGLRVRSLSKIFPGTRALLDVSFDVERGTIHALLGGNGSGKSTLIKVLAGVERGDPGGSVQFGGLGERSDRISPSWSAAAGLRFVHQDLGLFENLSVAENIYAGRRPPRRIGRIDWGRMRTDAQAVLDRLGIGIRASEDLRAVRPADRTLVAIARALPAADDMADALLVLDEPTARLANAEADKLLDALRRYAAQGQTILFVSHRLEEIFKLAGSVTVLRDGLHVHTGAVAALDNAALVELMIGREIPAQGPRAPRRIAETVLRVSRLAGGPLKRVDLTVSGGEIVGVAGLVGSGRSELLEAIFGARNCPEGSVEIGGQPLPPGRIASAISRRVSLVPEDRAGEGLFANLGIPENLSASNSRRYSRKMLFRHGAERRDAARTIEQMGIRAARVTSTVQSLSGGNQQKVLVGRWLGMQPKLLLLDEPTQGVDVAARQDIYLQIEAAAQRGCAVLLVSSDLDELLRLADRVVVLSAGQIVAQAEGEILTHKWIGERMYASAEHGAAA